MRHIWCDNLKIVPIITKCNAIALNRSIKWSQRRRTNSNITKRIEHNLNGNWCIFVPGSFSVEFVEMLKERERSMESDKIFNIIKMQHFILSTQHNWVNRQQSVSSLCPCKALTKCNQQCATHSMLKYESIFYPSAYLFYNKIKNMPRVRKKDI